MRTVIFTAWTLLCVGAAYGQDYPNKPVRFLTTAAGSSSDFAARIIATGIAPTLGTVIVDNRPSLPVAGALLANSPPDGYTLIYTGGALWIDTLLRKPPYDPVKDFAAVTLVASSPDILVVHPSLPVKSVKDLIALAKSKPGQLNYGTSTIGGASHLSAELLKNMAGVSITHIPYKGNGAIPALLSGEIQLLFEGGATLTPYIESGRLRALAVTSAKQSPLFPGMPTIAESGLPGYESSVMNVIFAPARTPDAIIRRLYQEIARFLHTKEAEDRFVKAGVEIVASTPDELTATMKADLAKWAKVIKEANIKVE
jgi:tripartite-type tricarboxylate transporter receptor subunit TctC